MAQPRNIWMKLASLVVASVNPGTFSYIVALAVIVGFSLSTILPAFEPGSMVKTLDETVEKTYIRYNEHKDMLDGSAGFDSRVKRYAQHIVAIQLSHGSSRLQVEAFDLQIRHLKARDNMSWTDRRSWGRYMWETKDIWVKARQRQREIIKLRKVLERAVLKAHRDELEAAFAHHGQRGEEEGEELDRTSVV